MNIELPFEKKKHSSEEKRTEESEILAEKNADRGSHEKEPLPKRVKPLGTTSKSNPVSLGATYGTFRSPSTKTLTSFFPSTTTTARPISTIFLATVSTAGNRTTLPSKVDSVEDDAFPPSREFYIFLSFGIVTSILFLIVLGFVARAALKCYRRRSASCDRTIVRFSPPENIEMVPLPHTVHSSFSDEGTTLTNQNYSPPLPRIPHEHIYDECPISSSSTSSTDEFYEPLLARAAVHALACRETDV